MKMFNMEGPSGVGYVTSRKRTPSERTEDPSYVEKRLRNNEAVKKSREKKRRESEETAKHVTNLERENAQLKHQHLLIRNRYETIKEIYRENFGPIDEQTERKLFSRED